MITPGELLPRSLNKELEDFTTPPERKEALAGALTLASKLSRYCIEHAIGPFRTDEDGNQVLWEPNTIHKTVMFRETF